MPTYCACHKAQRDAALLTADLFALCLVPCIAALMQLALGPGDCGVRACVHAQLPALTHWKHYFCWWFTCSWHPACVLHAQACTPSHRPHPARGGAIRQYHSADGAGGAGARDACSKRGHAPTALAAESCVPNIQRHASPLLSFHMPTTCWCCVQAGETDPCLCAT
jgi:hypothetical protein